MEMKCVRFRSTVSALAILVAIGPSAGRERDDATARATRDVRPNTPASSAMRARTASPTTISAGPVAGEFVATRIQAYR